MADALRQELPSLAIGVLVIATGLGSLLVCFVPRDGSDTALVYFGLFCLLYGTRLWIRSVTVVRLFDADEVLVRHVNDTITYAINLPLWLYVERTFGSGWRSSLRRLWQAWLLFATVAISFDWATRDRRSRTSGLPYRRPR